MKFLPFVLIFLLLIGCGSNSNSPAANNDLGISVVSNQKVSPYAVDMCTQFTGETCLFSGGQRVSFNDGSILLIGNYLFAYSNAGASDLNETSNTAFIPATATSGYVKLSGFVARGSGNKSLFLLWTRSPESLKLIYDTDSSNTPDATDETITTLSLSNW